MPIILPSALIERVQSGNAVLFLGAGASIDSISRNGLPCPKGTDLANMLSDKFLQGEDKHKSLTTIAAYAIDAYGLIPVQDYIREVFTAYDPADFHKKLASFRWAGIFTTNYDLVIERAYEANDDRVQDIVPIIKNQDRIDHLLRDQSRVPYNKLHGCITHWDRPEIPLILTVDQYVDHMKNRDSLFKRFSDYGREYTVIFIGHSLEDPDLHKALLELGKEEESRPKYFTVTPNVSQRDQSYWAARRIESISATLAQFVEALDLALDKSLRAVFTTEKKHEIERKFPGNDIHLSSDAFAALNNEITYIHEGMNIENVEAKEFFRGGSFGWSPIEKAFDIKRFVSETILVDCVLSDETDRPRSCDFYLITGHAGSGKSVALRRIAWDATRDYERICLYVETPYRFNVKAVLEIAEKCDERIFVFIDRCSLHIGEIANLIANAGKQKLKITVIGAERQNEWNVDCVSLHGFVNEQFPLRYMNEKEIGFLIDNLTKFGCLGFVEHLPRKEQEKAFREKAGRQLLVALYEVTLSKPFEQIVFDEYKNIEPEKARYIYRTVCALNRWGVQVRAGLIHRIFDITLDDFREKFFLPLEHIVKVRGGVSHDYHYSARHPYIAEFVYSQAFTDTQEKFDFIMLILANLDIGYSSDYKAFRETIKAKNLLAEFADPVLIRKIYDQCREMADNDDFYHQQIAIFEMKRDNPNFQIAEKHLDRAEDINPANTSIVHSRSVLQLLRAKNSSGLEKQRLLSDAESLAKQSIQQRNSNGEYGYQTICEIELEKLQSCLGQVIVDAQLVSEIVKRLEASLEEGLQKYPNSSYLTTSNSNFLTLLGESEKAAAVLEKAFQKNDASPYIALSLAKLYEQKGSYDKARSVLEKLLETQSADKPCNAYLGRLISIYYPDMAGQALIYMRRSFTLGDFNYLNQFWYARQLYILRKFEESLEGFRNLRAASVDPFTKHTIRGIYKENGATVKHVGVIVKMESTYALVKNDSYPGIHFLHKDNCEEDVWDTLSYNDRIGYTLGFTFHGPACKSPKKNER